MRVLAAGSLKAVWPALIAYFPEPDGRADSY